MNGFSLGFGATILRLVQGVAFMAHGPYFKGYVTGMAEQEAQFAALGFPPILAWVVMVLEGLAGAAFILGLQVRLFALACLPILLVAIGVHINNGWLFASPGGGWEYPAFWAGALVAQVFLGAGSFALWNADIVASLAQRLVFRSAPNAPAAE